MATGDKPEEGQTPLSAQDRLLMLMGAEPFKMQAMVADVLEPALADQGKALVEMSRMLPEEAVSLLPIIHALAARLTILETRVQVGAQFGGHYGRTLTSQATAYLNKRAVTIVDEVRETWERRAQDE